MRLASSNSLPPEVLELIFDRVQEPSLARVLLVNSTFYALGCRSLYRELRRGTSPRPKTRQLILLLETLAPFN